MTKKNFIRDNKTLIFAVFILTFAKLVVNISRRFPYAFLPTISRQLGVPLASVQTVMATQAGIGISSPVFGPYVERYGRKRTLMFSLALMTAGSLLGMLLPQFWTFAVVMWVLGFAKMLFDPSLLAYLGDRIPYHRRGTVIGVTELSWAGSLFIAAPVVGLIFTLTTTTHTPAVFLRVAGIPFSPIVAGSIGLQVVFGLLAALSLIALTAIQLYIPADHPQKDAVTERITPMMTWQVMRGSPAGMAAIGYAFTIAVASEIFLINYGLWMELSFELMLATLGAVTTVISLAEIIGEVTVIGISDRIGKRRLSLIGAGIAAVMYLILPNLTFSLVAALAGIFVLFVFTEISIVSAFPLFTEVMPENRAIMLSSAVGGAASGRLVGAILGGVLYALLGDFTMIGAVSMVICAFGFGLMWVYVKE